MSYFLRCPEWSWKTTRDTATKLDIGGYVRYPSGKHLIQRAPPSRLLRVQSMPGLGSAAEVSHAVRGDGGGSTVRHLYFVSGLADCAQRMKEQEYTHSLG